MTQEHESKTYQSWQAMIGIVEALGKYEEAKNISQSEWHLFGEQGVPKQFNELYEGYTSNVVKNIGKVIVKVCHFCYFEGICFDDIVKNTRKSIIERNLMTLTGKLAAAYLGAVNSGEKGNLHRSDIYIILAYILGILKSQARIWGSDIEIVESDIGSRGVAVWTNPSNSSVQIKVFVPSSPKTPSEYKSSTKLGDSAEYVKDVVMLRRIEELMAEAEEWSDDDDLHDCVMKVLDERNEWKKKATSLANELDAFKAMHTPDQCSRWVRGSPTNLKLHSRKEARARVVPFLRKNAKIFMECTGEYLKQRILAEVIPNNRIILEIIDANKVYLNNDEYEVVEAFRIHVDNFESRHCGGDRNYKVKKFPSEIKQVFAQDMLGFFDG